MWLGIYCIGGLGATWSLLPEPNGLDLEKASRDHAFGAKDGGPQLQPAPT